MEEKYAIDLNNAKILCAFNNRLWQQRPLRSTFVFTYYNSCKKSNRSSILQICFV